MDAVLALRHFSFDEQERCGDVDDDPDAFQTAGFLAAHEGIGQQQRHPIGGVLPDRRFRIVLQPPLASATAGVNRAGERADQLLLGPRHPIRLARNGFDRGGEGAEVDDQVLAEFRSPRGLGQFAREARHDRQVTIERAIAARGLGRHRLDFGKDVGEWTIGCLQDTQRAPVVHRRHAAIEPGGHCQPQLLVQARPEHALQLARF